MSTADPLSADVEDLITELSGASGAIADTRRAANDTIARAQTLLGRSSASPGVQRLREELACLQRLLGSATEDAAGVAPCDGLAHHHAALTIELWKKTVDVQQHFNDLELRIRNFAITVLITVIGAAAFAFKENLHVTIGTYAGSLAAGLLLAGILSWLAFYFMDRWWYHQLLLGAVYHGGDLENELANHFRNPKLGARINRASPIKHGFSTAVGLATIATALVVTLAPSTATAIIVLVVVAVAMIYTKHVGAHRALRQRDRSSVEQRLLARRTTTDGIFFLLLLGATFAYNWFVPAVVVCIGGVALVLLVVQHEQADAWAMRSSQKVDVFYLAGLLLYLGIFFGIQHATHAVTPSEQMTESRTHISLRPAGAPKQTSTSRSTAP